MQIHRMPVAYVKTGGTLRFDVTPPNLTSDLKIERQRVFSKGIRFLFHPLFGSSNTKDRPDTDSKPQARRESKKKSRKREKKRFTEECISLSSRSSVPLARLAAANSLRNRP